MRSSRMLLCLCAILTGCQPSTTIPPPLDWSAFDKDRAYQHVEQLVAFGPRPSGSTELIQAGNYIVEQLRIVGLEVEEQRFRKPTRRGEVVFRNIIGRTRGTVAPDRGIVILGSHYDTKWMPDIRFVGANDGGSSTGVLLEMARVAANQPGLWFVFFDGEECMEQYDESDGLWGSRYFVEQLRGSHHRIQALLLLDMVGDANLTVTIPSSSTGWLVLRVFEAAKALGVRDYFRYGDLDILDDHTPFLEAGIPAVNLIDFEYGSEPGRNDYWHTDQDTMAHISAESLGVVGQTALRVLANFHQDVKPMR